MEFPIVGAGKPPVYQLEWEDAAGHVTTLNGRTFTVHELAGITLMRWPAETAPGDVEAFHRYLVQLNQAASVLHVIGDVGVFRARPVAQSVAPPPAVVVAPPGEAPPQAGTATHKTPLYGPLGKQA